MNGINGFILSSHYYDTRNGIELVFYISTDIGPAKVIISDFKPVFFIETNSKEVSISNLSERKTVNLKSFTGQKVDALYFKNQADLYKAKDSLAALGVRTYESDVRPTERYLMERFINGDICVNGEFHEQGKLKVFINPKVSKCNYKLKPKVLSFDIETSFGNDLYSIGVHYYEDGRQYKKVHMVAEESKVISDELEYYNGEKSVLLAFKSELLKEDPDFILGWHVVGFDLMFLERKFLQYGVPFNFGRDGEKNRLVESKGKGFFATIPGRVVLDGPPVMRGAFYSFENFKLDTVASELLGVGKDITSSGASKVEEIERRFKEDKESLAKYNLLDCTLVSDIFKKTGLIELCVTRSKICGMNIDRLGSSTGAFDHFMLPLIHRKGFVAPNVLDIQRDAHAAGGLVLDPKVGLFENVIVLDFKSLYPSIIKTFKIDPYSRIMSDHSMIETPTGHKFSRVEHILPDFITELFAKRQNAKDNGDSHLSMAIKILMNSFYGVMGSPGCRFYHADLPTAITGTGQWVLKQAIGYFEGLGYEVLYGDTDSVFVKLKPEDTFRIKEKANELVRSSNEFMTKKIQTLFNCESFLEIEFETVFKKFFLPKARGSEGGAKKRYAGLITDKGKEELYFSGMEIVRSDWTKVAKNFQYTLFEKMFSGEDMEEYIKNYVERLKNGEFDDQLIYRKRLTKNIDEYVKMIPPHVKAAIVLRDRTGKEQEKSIE